MSAVRQISGVFARTRSAGSRAAERLRKRPGALVAGLLALALGAGAAAAVEPLTGKSLGQVLAADADGAAADVPCDEPAPDLPAAWERAKACGHEIESLADRTEYTTTYGTVDELVREEISAAAVRSRTADGGWRAIDTSIVPGDDGRLEVAAPGLAEISFADPGATGADPGAPLAVLERDGHELEFDVPFGLAPPVVEGDRVTYPALFGDPGIELTVMPNGDGTGIREVITVDDAESAANPGLAELDFRVEVSGGLRLAAAGGGFVAEDEAGAQVFRAPQPTGWTAEGHEPAQVAGMTAASGSTASSGVAPGDVVDGPGSYGAVFEMDTDVRVDDADRGRSATVSVRPDQAVLTDPDTVYPLALDPSVSGSLNEFTAVKSYWPTSTSGYGFGDTSDGTHGIGLCDAADPYGYECMGATSKHRIMYEFNGLEKVKNAAAGDVSSASFEVYGTHSYNCTAHTVAAYRLGASAVSSSTSWDNMNPWLTENRQDGVGIAHKLGECGGRKWVGFNVTEALDTVASADWSSITLGLKVDESSMEYWKRYAGRRMEYGGTWYDRPARLSVTYNRAPYAPTGRQTRSVVPVQNWGCRPSSDAVRMPTRHPQLKAKASDPDWQSLRVQFLIQRVSNQTTVWTAWTSAQASGLVHTARPSSGNALTEGVTYRWRAKAKDSAGRTGPVTGWCYFTPDLTKPNPPSIEAATDRGAEANYPDCSTGSATCAEAGGVGQTGDFRFGLNGSTDVATFQWSWDSEEFDKAHAPWSSNTYVTSYTPQAPGPHTLYARSVDRAGNVSDVASYKIDVAYPLANGYWKMDDGPGSTTVQDWSQLQVPNPLTLHGSGVSWTNGPHELFDSRDGDRALVFDGTDGRAVANGQVVETAESFVVSAFVWLDADVSQSAVAVSQDGSRTSAFKLGYRTDCGGGADCWDFWVHDADVDAATAAHAVSSANPVLREWTHLVGAYDAAGTVNIWVCEAGTPGDPKAGEPVHDQANVGFTPFHSTGNFAVGRSLRAGVHRDPFNGYVDEVRVWDGTVIAEAKIRRLCQGAGGDDFAGDVALDPTEQIDIDE
ncbi:LamG domain-containing protein [Myceligenerans pegani]|uniref:LamG domain-containing protein n=1 Tax=Myceligenerans pegani TaxID=2776917 RepID=A0ABR9MX39_9MICO|nr:LamG domain-containing protein [Myceligenerans sp. TRM 65318]MBE1875347.1 LamG domain-containing protein [Myceligenerans sp. TRM 65318]MBE3017618.1 LamG domain-containing protein [Myceligenerans sp. TRM 65318]